eukprot:TRINITY_DN6293_c0_g1_i1.p1 TRINITY_DN6293_c0_g1~~TRINITY_DN6293_c0_g1_i1.p1  ORF type:complete len:1033 (-),score=164.52 TRINITY_DN6293_c0_g1_i1:42-3140(-)
MANADGYLLIEFVKQNLSNIRKSKVNYCLGFSACFVVVFVVSLLVTILSRSPLIFLRLAELQNAEIDMMLTSGTWSGYEHLNYTKVSEVLEDHPYHAPRRHYDLYFYKCFNGLDPYDLDWKYIPSSDGDVCQYYNSGIDCFHSHCSGTSHHARLMLYDNEQEKKIGLGREWGYDTLELGEIYMQASLASRSGTSKGDNITIQIDAVDWFRYLYWNEWTGNYTEEMFLGGIWSNKIYISLTVKDIVGVNGKVEHDREDVLFLEYSHIGQLLLANLHPNMPEYVRRKISERNDNYLEFVERIVVNLPDPRSDYYLESNYISQQKNVIDVTDKIIYALGYSSVETTLPVLDKLEDFQFFSLFLGLVLNLIIFILLFLSVLLIYSLLMINVETKTFELGVLRMIGAKKKAIIMLVLVQALSYSLPSWIFGILASYGTSFYVSNYVTKSTGVPVPSGLNSSGVAWATFLGYAVPIVSSIFPIMNALNKNLQDSLDTRRSKTAAVKVKLERSDQTKAINWNIVAIGSLLAAFGSGVYYVFPLALLTMNLGILLNIFFFLLIGLLLGLTLLALNVQPLLERAVVFLFLWFDAKAIRKIVFKNLIAHRIRNRKTTIMYSLSLGFIIFVSVAYSLQASTFKFNAEQSGGCHLRVRANNYNAGSKTLPTINMFMEEIEEYLNNHRYVLSHTFVTHPLQNAILDAKSTKISNVGRVFDFQNYVYGVSPGFYDTTIKGFLHTGDSPVYKYDLIRALYSQENSGKAIVGTIYQDSLGLELDKEFLLKVVTQTQSDDEELGLVEEKRWVLKPLAFLDSSPFFTFSPYPIQGFSPQDVLVSMPTFLKLTNGAYKNFHELPYKHVLIDLRKNITDNYIRKMKSDLRKITNLGRGSFSIWDYRRETEIFDSTEVAMNLFFNFTTVIAMAISFFSLLSSMFTNVREQSKEIGVMRAMGITKFRMIRVYIYEAFVLVLSSSLLGVMIGMSVGYTMTLQQILFTQLPLSLEIPYYLMITVFVMSIVFAILAAYSPIKRVTDLKIVQIFRLVN